MEKLDKTEYLTPDKNKIKHEIKIKFKDEFLSLNNLKIGDLVILPFDFQRVYKEPRKQPNTVTWTQMENGILKEDKDGYLYAESLKDMQFYRLNTDSKREFYESYYKKSIYRFSIGFI